ncbi:MAG: TonB C-terminal domain-containing protein [Myxococcaceae bacterium]|nr:TonB C-terminal domain-containing protein [Myxococcaceae bacterium]
MKPRNDRWTYWALAASLALHGAAFVVVVRTPDRVAPASERTRISLVEIEFPTPPPEPPAPPAVEPKAPPRPAPAAPRVRPAPAPPPPDERPLASDRPQADAPVEPRLEAPRIERPSLVPGGSFALSLDAGAFLEDDEPKGLRAPTVSTDLVGDLTRDTIGRGKVDRGLVHPYYVQLGKALIKNWDADRAMNQKGGLAGYGEQFVQNTKLFNEIWLDKAAQFGATGAPIDAPVSNDNASRRTALVNNGIQGIQGVDLEARKEVSRQMREQFKTTRRATIRVTQDLGGRLLKVELLSPSNDATVDKEAMADVRAAAEKLPPPPTEATEGKRNLVSVWAFELVVSISPPVPTFTFEFDEALGFIDARLPLDRRIYKKVRLVSVD